MEGVEKHPRKKWSAAVQPTSSRQSDSDVEMKDLKGKNAIVTGAGRGIGFAIAKKYLAEGARVVAVDVDRSGLLEAVESLSSYGSVFAVVADVSDARSCESAVDSALQDLDGRVDILVNNAGIVVIKPFLETTEEDWDRTLAVDLKSIFLLSKLVAPLMIEQGSGVILNAASTNGHVAEKLVAAYDAAKGGVVMLTKSMALEFAEHNVRVICVSPGLIGPTGLTSAAGYESNPDDLAPRIAMGRIGHPDEVASLYAFLASDEASYITGHSYIIDGGQIAEQH